jgi:hypothetical protein
MDDRDIRVLVADVRRGRLSRRDFLTAMTAAVGAANTRLQGMDLNGWDSTLWRLPYWYKA